MEEQQCSYENCPAAKRYEKRKRRKGVKFTGVVLIVCLLTVIAFSVGNVDRPRGEYIAVLDIRGTISENDGSTYDQQYLLDSVDELIHDDHNRGLLLRIDSPGGAVYQIDELYLKLMAYKEETERPVYAAIGSYAASGGYYEACAADKIYANRNAITGSIGVIMGEFFDISGLLDELGVNVTYVSTGDNKGMGGYYEPMTAEQRAIYQSVCDEAFEQFIDVIVQGRGMTEEQVRALADGRIYTANQALQHGLIDGVESCDETLERMITDLGYEELEVWDYSYQAPVGLFDYLASGNVQQLAEKLTGQSENQLLTEQKPPQVMMYFNGS